MTYEFINIPAQVYNVCNTTGIIIPTRFKFKDKEEQIKEIHINNIISRKETQYVGRDCLIYICKAIYEENYTLFELKYWVATHNWEISKILS